MNIIKLTTLSILTSSLMLGSDSIVESVGLNLGMSNTTYTHTNNNGSVASNNPDKNFNSFEIYTTLNPIMDYCKNNNIKPYISYTNSYNSDIKNQYLLVGVNKYYDIKSSKLYAGILGGYGELKWRYNPINNSKDNDYSATSFIVGVQTGYNYPITNNLTLNLNLKALTHNYKTKLKPTTAIATIEHKYTTVGMVGIGWSF